jgi:hypothetical protein
MENINLLIIDDEVDEVQRYIKRLKLNDDNKIIKECYFANKLPVGVEDIENFDIIRSANIDEDTIINALLIDYDLGKSYSGTLLSAWLMMKNRCIPRIAFTTKKYTGGNTDFDGYIEKRDIISNPKKIISTIIDTISKFNLNEWLSLKQNEFVTIYSQLTLKKLNNSISKEEIITLELISKILDSLDKQLDREIENSIAIKLKLSEKRNDNISELEKDIEELDLKIEDILSRFEK